MAEKGLYRYETCLYLVNEMYFLLLQETNEGYHYDIFSAETRRSIIADDGSGRDIPLRDILHFDSPDGNRSFVDNARRIAVRDSGIKEPATIARVALQMLKKFPYARQFAKMGCVAAAESEKSIRFIDPGYNEKFRIPDGAAVVLTNSSGEKNIAPCRYIDETHLCLAGSVYHICELAEFIERNHARIDSEPISRDTDGAWKIGTHNYLYIQECDEGWDYTVYDEEYRLVDGGILCDVESMLNEAREQIIQLQFGNNCLNMWRSPVDCESLMEKVDDCS